MISLSVIFTTGFIIALLTISFSVLISKYTKLLTKYQQNIKYLKSLLQCISSARWGNLQTKAQNGFSPLTNELSKSLNSLLESILDRDKMIIEYVEKEKENNEIKEDFIAMLTHDLKVPIIAQDNTLDLLLDNKFGELNDEQKDAIKNIKISNHDLRHLVESLLDSHKFEKKGFTPKIQKDINLRNFIDDIILQTNSIAALHNKKIRLYDHLEPNYVFDTDVLLLKRVIQNLILNAISYGVNSEYIDITLENNDTNCVIRVKDYGVGISKENIDKIFNKYYCAAELYSKASMGLGLYLSNKIIGTLDGRITVASEENKGSEFSIIIKNDSKICSL